MLLIASVDTVIKSLVVNVYSGERMVIHQLSQSFLRDTSFQLIFSIPMTCMPFTEDVTIRKLQENDGQH